MSFAHVKLSLYHSRVAPVDMVEAPDKSKLARLGDVKKCPACGSAIDAEAYHCPKCRTDFCFHCRARVGKGEKQFQCVNKICAYHGKLLCDQCEITLVREEPPAEYIEHEDGWWPLLVPLLLLAWLILWLFYLPLGQAFWYSLGGTVIFGAILQAGRVNIIGRKRKVLQPRTTTVQTCISCSEPVKTLVPR